MKLFFATTTFFRNPSIISAETLEEAQELLLRDEFSYVGIEEIEERNKILNTYTISELLPLKNGGVIALPKTSPHDSSYRSKASHEKFHEEYALKV